MLTAVYFSNRDPHAALANATPYKTIYDKDAHLGHLRAIGAKASMHVEAHTTKPGRRAWEGRLVGYSVDSKSIRVDNPETRSVRESRNVMFIETPSVMHEPDFVGGFDEEDFTYDEYHDMVRDARNYTSNLDLSSPPAADREVQDPSVRDLLQTIRATTNHPHGSGLFRSKSQQNLRSNDDFVILLSQVSDEQETLDRWMQSDSHLQMSAQRTSPSHTQQKGRRAPEGAGGCRKTCTSSGDISDI